MPNVSQVPTGMGQSGPKNGQIWPKTGFSGQIWAFLAHLIQFLTKKQFEQVAQVVFRFVDTKTFTYSHKSQDFWPINGQIWPKIDFFGQILAFLAHLIPCPTNKQCEQGAQVVFPLNGYQNFCFLPKELGFLAPKQPNLVQNMHFWSFWAKYWHFWPISSNA